MKEKLEPPDGYVFVCVYCAEEIAIKLEDVGEVATNEAYELADELDRVLQVSGCDNRVPRMLRQQADRITKLEGELSRYELRDLEQTSRIATLENQLDKCSHHEAMAHQGGYELGKASQIKELSDDELNKAFDYYCETDEGVLRFNYELRDEWKKEQLIRWKEALKKASEK